MKKHLPVNKAAQRREVAGWVAELDALGSGDPEGAHCEADEILLKAVPAEVAAAWSRAADRIGFWYA